MAFKLIDRRTLSLAALAAFVFVLASGATLSARTYQKPPQAVLDVLNAPVPPTGVLSPSREYMLLAQGVPARVVMDILGHSQIAVTMDIYSHVLPAMQDDAAERMNRVLS